jgi:hypothetical protein
MFMLVGSVVSWASKKQQSIALFITKKKTEYMALKKVIVEVIWFHINSYMH